MPAWTHNLSIHCLSQFHKGEADNVPSSNILVLKAVKGSSGIHCSWFLLKAFRSSKPLTHLH
jgi:hypothetical protein